MSRKARYVSPKFDAWNDFNAWKRDEGRRARGRITLPKIGVRLEPIFRGEKRKSVVNKTMEVLRKWRLSPFENEASARAGLRSALCLKGYPWAKADAEAAALVSEALSLLGARRPTWEQGQREYVVSRENCSWCGIVIPEDLLHGNYSIRFCSDVCARAAVQQRTFEDRRHNSEMYRSAWDIIQRTRNPARPCKHCGTMFRPVFDAGTGAAKGDYCSQKCNGASKRYLQPRYCVQCGTKFQPKNYSVKLCSRACAQLYHRKDIPNVNCRNCGTSFRPSHVKNEAMFCSRACKYEFGHTTRYEKECAWCSAPFTASLPTARYCSGSCATAYSGMRNGKRIPKRLNAPVLDYLFRQQGLRITPERIAA